MSARGRRGLVTAALMTIVGVAILASLGVWQLERRNAKHALLARLNERLAAAPTPLPPAIAWKDLRPQQDEFRRVRFSAAVSRGGEALVYTAGSALRPDVSGVGYWVLSPAKIEASGTVLVNRGFVSETQKAAARDGAGTVDITGVLRWPEDRGMFTPDDRPDKNLWFTRDPQAIARAKGWGEVAPFYIEQESLNPGGVPKAGRVEPRLSDNHMQYAITWFALAAGLALVFGFWARTQLTAKSLT